VSPRDPRTARDGSFVPGFASHCQRAGLRGDVLDVDNGDGRSLVDKLAFNTGGSHPAAFCGLSVIPSMHPFVCVHFHSSRLQQVELPMHLVCTNFLCCEHDTKVHAAKSILRQIPQVSCFIALFCVVKLRSCGPQSSRRVEKSTRTHFSIRCLHAPPPPVPDGHHRRSRKCVSI
jgi:hypothetical protein